MCNPNMVQFILITEMEKIDQLHLFEPLTELLDRAGRFPISYWNFSAGGHDRFGGGKWITR